MSAMYFAGEGVEKDISTAKSLLEFIKKQEAKKNKQ